MKRFRVTVNGNEYEVVVEELGDGEASSSVKTGSAREQASPQRVDTPAKIQNKGNAPSAGKGTQVKAPLAGTIRSVKVSVGTAVKRGDLLVTLEALKLENEIQAPVDGTVTFVGVSEGQNVEMGAVLVVIE